MYSGYIGIIGMVHDFRLIAVIFSFEIRKAGPYLTLLILILEA